jgi:putative ABC transport system permease protein
MILLQLKNAFRNITKRKDISFVMVISLIVGLTTVFLLMGFVINEYAVDNFHRYKDRIVRMQSDDPWVEGKKMIDITSKTPSYIKNNFPEVENYCQLNRHGFDQVKANNNNYYARFNNYETNPSFFVIFSYNFIEGNPSTALSTKTNIILSEQTAFKFFGNTKALGKTIDVKEDGIDKTYIVSAVIKQAERSHLAFDMLTSIEGKEMRTSNAYLLLKENAEIHVLENKLNKHKSEIPFFWEGKTTNYYLQDLKSINITQEVKSKIAISLAISAIVFFIAFFNYISLFINLTIEREKELSIRKIIGSSNKDLIASLGIESALLVALSTLLSIMLLKWILPTFNQLNDSNLFFSDFMHSQVLTILFITIFLVIVLSYLTILLFIRKPFRYSGSFTNIMAMNRKNKFAFIHVVQYAISIILIICAITLYRQVNFIHHKEIGLNRNVVEFRLPAAYSDKKEAIKNTLISHSSIEKVSICDASPVREASMIGFKYEDKGESKEYTCLFFRGDEDYINTLDVKIIEGSEHSLANASNDHLCYVNESLLRFFQMKNPIGKIVPGSQMEIAGVVKDFHWSGLENIIPPAVIVINNKGRNILVKMKEGRQTAGLDFTKNTWEKLISDYPFEYFTIGGLFNEKHKKYEILVQFISFFCIISIILSSMGLVALSLFTLRKKVKEIGIRKVNGAKIYEILELINSNLIKRIIIGFIIACPIAWYAMHQWLQNFAYKTELSWWVFALAGIVAVAIAIITVSWQSWRAATRNPVESLRYE